VPGESGTGCRWAGCVRKYSRGSAAKRGDGEARPLGGSLETERCRGNASCCCGGRGTLGEGLLGVGPPERTIRWERSRSTRSCSARSLRSCSQRVTRDPSCFRRSSSDICVTSFSTGACDGSGGATSPRPRALSTRDSCPLCSCRTAPHPLRIGFSTAVRGSSTCAQVTLSLGEPAAAVAVSHCSASRFARRSPWSRAARSPRSLRSRSRARSRERRRRRRTSTVLLKSAEPSRTVHNTSKSRSVAPACCMSTAASPRSAPEESQGGGDRV